MAPLPSRLTTVDPAVSGACGDKRFADCQAGRGHGRGGGGGQGAATLGAGSFGNVKSEESSIFQL